MSFTYDSNITYQYKVRTKPVNLFPVTSPAMVIAITKRMKASETKREKWEKPLSLPQFANFP